jgi:hypothetical protein
MLVIRRGNSLGRQSGACFRVVSQEVLKRPEQLGSVFDPPAVESLADVIDDHHPNSLAAVWLVQQVIRQSGRGYFGHMFMFADRRDFILVETAKVHTVLQRDHAMLL